MWRIYITFAISYEKPNIDSGILGYDISIHKQIPRAIYTTKAVLLAKISRTNKPIIVIKQTKHPLTAQWITKTLSTIQDLYKQYKIAHR